MNYVEFEEIGAREYHESSVAAIDAARLYRYALKLREIAKRTIVHAPWCETAPRTEGVDYDVIRACDCGCDEKRGGLGL